MREGVSANYLYDKRALAPASRTLNRKQQRRDFRVVGFALDGTSLLPPYTRREPRFKRYDRLAAWKLQAVLRDLPHEILK